ncbi:hypothetical protein BZA77DRAFT_295309 [Pyronema omphalodes]|nr:hypothetical protein BZA77DRAFT_295309 [Pyronema omphalodes]
MKFLVPLLFSLATLTIAAPATPGAPSNAQMINPPPHPMMGVKPATPPARPGSPLKNVVNVDKLPKAAEPAKPAVATKPGVNFPNGIHVNGLPTAKLTDCNFLKVGKPGNTVKGISACCPPTFVGCTQYDPKLGCGPRMEVCCDKSVGVPGDPQKARANCVTNAFSTGP